MSERGAVRELDRSDERLHPVRVRPFARVEEDADELWFERDHLRLEVGEIGWRPADLRVQVLVELAAVAAEAPDEAALAIQRELRCVERRRCSHPAWPMLESHLSRGAARARTRRRLRSETARDADRTVEAPGRLRRGTGTPASFATRVAFIRDTTFAPSLLVGLSHSPTRVSTLQHPSRSRALADSPAPLKKRSRGRSAPYVVSGGGEPAQSDLQASPGTQRIGTVRCASCSSSSCSRQRACSRSTSSRRPLRARRPLLRRACSRLVEAGEAVAADGRGRVRA